MASVAWRLMPIWNSRLSSSATIAESDSGEPKKGASTAGTPRNTSGTTSRLMPAMIDRPTMNTRRSDRRRDRISSMPDVIR